MGEPTAYPLAWPAHKPRTDWRFRKAGQFKKEDRHISRDQAIKRVRGELDKMGAKNLVASTDVPIRRDGMPYSNRSEEPSDPGCCIYFQIGDKPYAMACDTFDNLAQNIAAVAAHLSATRAMERYGVATTAETIQAFTALPPPAPKTTLDWRPILKDPTSLADAEDTYRILARRYHPDAPNGSQAAMADLNAAIDAARKELS